MDITTVVSPRSIGLSIQRNVDRRKGPSEKRKVHGREDKNTDRAVVRRRTLEENVGDGRKASPLVRVLG